jgi:tRNA threonylcarbamoyladenosine biosynthesis protein TsaB
MALILNIDTAVETASVCLSENAELLQSFINDNRKDHASWLHPVIEKIIIEGEKKISTIDAIAVTIGPGSYTGLRIGLSAAKGLCYALNIPLITINTLLVMAYADKNTEGDLLCPMIDARRNEVFTAIYNKPLEEVVKPSAMLIHERSFSDMFESHRIIFSGNGSQKLKSVINHPNAFFSDTIMTAADMTYLSESYFQKRDFADIAYAEPLYLKEFYSPAR